MHTKLTLRVDERLIQRAKAYSRRTGKSVSQLVADYFAILDTPVDAELQDLPPITRALSGILAGTEPVDEEEYHRYLEEKYR